MKFLIGLFLVLNTVLPAHGAATRTVVADQIKNSLQTQTYLFPASGDTLVGTAATQTLTNKTLTLPVITSISNSGTVTVPSGAGTLATIAGTQVITNKDIDGGTASNTSRITIPKAAKTTLDALTRKQGTIVFDTTSNKPYYDDGTNLQLVGSGSGGVKNYITGGDAESGTTGFATYNDVAGASPVDGNSGSPVVTWTTTATTPLENTNSFLLTKGATNRQGDGVSYAFTIDRQDQAKVLQVSFNYLVSSGTFAAGTSSTASDVTVWIYDVTNAVLIQPSSINLLSNSTTVADKFNATFQTASNSTSYRLILHIGSTSASAYTLKIDSIAVSPSTYVYGTPITDWVAYTPTLSSSTNATVNTSQYRRVGDSIEVRGFITWSGAGGGSGFSVSLPSGFSIDTNKINSTVQNGLIGQAQWFDNGTARKIVGVTYNTTTNVTFEELTSSAGALTGPGFAASDTLSYFFHVPISGWSSSVQTSDQADTRVVAFDASSPTGTYTSTTTKVTGWVKNLDTHNAFDSVNNRYVIPVSGNYKVSATMAVNNTSFAVTTSIYKNGSLYRKSSAYSNGSINASPTTDLVMPLVVGDYIEVFFQTSSAVATGLDTSISGWSIARITGPSAIAATESYNFRYTNVAGTALTSGSNTLTFATKDYDSHGSWVTNTFTPQIGGKFNCSVKISVNTITGLSTNYLRILVAGSTVSEKALAFSYSTASPYTFDLTDDISVTAGQAVTFQFQNGFGSTINMDTGVGRNSVACKRVGN